MAMMGQHPNAAYNTAQKIARYRRDYRAFALEQLKLSGRPFEFWPCQIPLVESIERQLKDKGFARCVWLKGRQVGGCLDKDTLVLTSDLRWIRIDDVGVGTELVATDEFPPGGHGIGRRLQPATVVAKWEVYEPAFHLLMDNGESLIATAEHKFLSRKNRGKATDTCWRPVGKMRVGDPIRVVTHPWNSPTYEDGWFSGLLDGEGSFRARPEGGAEATVTQVAGVVLERAFDYLKAGGYTFRVDADTREAGDSSKLGSQPVHKIHLCRMSELFRLIGQTRPSRFIEKSWWQGKGLPGKSRGGDTAWARIVSITPLGPRPMIDLQTTTKTYIAEGFVSHNSTLAESFVSWRTMLWPHVNALVIADEQERARNLFEISKSFYESLDEDIRPVGRYITKRELVFANPSVATRGKDPGLRSRIVTESAHKKNIAIGAAWQIVHLSECARFPDPRFVIDGVIPAVHRIPGTIAIFESSAEQSGQWFRDFCESSERGQTAFEFQFVPFWLQPEYFEPLLPGEHFESDADERQIMAEFGLLPGHIKWMRSKLGEMNNDWNLFRQSYPLRPSDAWITPGAQVFPQKSLNELRAMVRPPIRRCEIQPGPRIVDATLGRLSIWEEPNPSKAYDIGVDVAMGIGEDHVMDDDTHDNSVAVVLERGSNKQVAEWVSKAIDPFDLANMMFWLGKYYNTAQIAIETNSIGGGTNQQLAKMGYTNQYIWRYRDEIVPRYSRKTGWETNPRSKPWLVGFSVHEMVNGRTEIRSELLLREMESFVQKAVREWGAVAGHHDDRVMAWMIALLTSDDENFERYYGLQKETAQQAGTSNPANIHVDGVSVGSGKYKPNPWEADLTFNRKTKENEFAPWDDR